MNANRLKSDFAFKRLFPCLFLIFVLSGSQTTPAEDEPVVGGPCGDCVAIFQGLPDSIASVTQITSSREPGEKLTLRGTVKRKNGKVASGVIVYIYHTNEKGDYPPDTLYPGKAAYRHGLLRGWAKTDSSGQYEFRTIRPASYPDTDIAQHIHMHILEPDCATYVIDEIHFDDDPLFRPNQRSQTSSPRGGKGIVHPVRDKQGVWQVVRDILLGESVPGYPDCKQ